MKNTIKYVSKMSVVVVIAVCVSGCRPSNQQSTVAPTSGPSISLSIVGFNYTNKPINEFFVNGIGGGNLHLSSAMDSGGGSVCCVDYSPAYRPEPVEIRWTVGACLYNTRHDKFGEKFTDIHYFFKTVDTAIAKYPAKPHFLEVHFYPDDRVEVALTEKLSSPRLILDESRGGNDSYGHCENDKKPK